MISTLFGLEGTFDLGKEALSLSQQVSVAPMSRRGQGSPEDNGMFIDHGMTLSDFH